ncbi:unnamed protein product, partial [Brenthis ino]
MGLTSGSWSDHEQDKRRPRECLLTRHIASLPAPAPAAACRFSLIFAGQLAAPFLIPTLLRLITNAMFPTSA